MKVDKFVFVDVLRWKWKSRAFQESSALQLQDSITAFCNYYYPVTTQKNTGSVEATFIRCSRCKSPNIFKQKHHIKYLDTYTKH